MPAPAPLPEGLSPLETALIDTLRHGQDTMTAEFRSLRWSMLGLIVFLVASVVAMKGIDPTVPASAVPAVLGGPVP